MNKNTIFFLIEFHFNLCENKDRIIKTSSNFLLNEINYYNSKLFHPPDKQEPRKPITILLIIIN
ncbi:hypothetical protein BpHYR1_020554 [Brachionus plicatilis]|uniref:Uncharacterized protein n=1 Tax=Brachionus plicatilis TaxID=10195 RepID=A0A3M7S878_BRAPC|nr:hypothetical protein BpHYR1_020554 [Brachionus plicatilis]